MLETTDFSKLILIDIETVPAVPVLTDLSAEMQELWELKQGRFREEDELTQDYYFERAGILAEFGKIICISVGIFDLKNDKRQLRVKSYHGDNEKKVLAAFATMLDQYFGNPYKYTLCGHNAREFDFPYICRRLLINDLGLPKLLNISALKPWEVPHMDTMQLWKFGDYKNFTSLRLLAEILNIPTPKDDIDGSDVARVYWEENGLERIKNYCNKDVLTVAQLLLKFKKLPLLKNNEVVFV